MGTFKIRLQRYFGVSSIHPNPITALTMRRWVEQGIILKRYVLSSPDMDGQISELFHGILEIKYSNDAAVDANADQ